MNEPDYARLAYLVILGIAVGGWFLAENRANLGKSARHAIIWGLIFIGVIAAVGLWSDIRDDVLPRQTSIGAGTIKVPRAADGHYYLVLRVNGVRVRFVVDTGASDIVLSLDDARRVGIDTGALVFSGRASTANGIVKTAFTRVRELQLEDLRDTDVSVAVNEGEMGESLLGMAYLRRFRSIQIARGKLILER